MNANPVGGSSGSSLQLSLAPNEVSAAAAALGQTAPSPQAYDQPREPVHVLYGGAHLFRFDSVRKLGAIACDSLATYAPNAEAFATTFGLPLDFAQRVRERVAAKLVNEPIEDLRIDFEDGYGPRPPSDEDTHAVSAARELARAFAEGLLPPFVGIRIRSFAPATFARATRTLDLFLTALARDTRGQLPPRFVVTLPKVTCAAHTATLAALLDKLEAALVLSPQVGIEIMVEDPAALISPAGLCPLPSIVAAARNRCVAAHFGAYDYTAACGVAAPHQRLNHPACDYARSIMSAALAASGARLADGATTTLPVPPHRPPKTSAEHSANAHAVHAAWRRHYDDVRRSLAQGFYQSWDLHPAQLVSRYAAVFAFYLEGLDDAARRLRAFRENAERATRAGSVFDDAATGRGLITFFARGRACGALSEGDAQEAQGDPLPL